MAPRLRAIYRIAAALLIALLPGTAAARKGSLAVVNLKTRAGAEVVHKAAQDLADHVGGWARQPKIAAYLAGKPLEKSSLPDGATGEDLERLILAIRESEGALDTGDLGNLGQLLGVDYLLLVKVKAKEERLTARLFSVHKRQFGPKGFEAKLDETARLKAFVLDQSGQKAAAGQKKGFFGKRWWIWAIAGAVAAAGLVLVFTLPDDSVGDLKIRVTR